MHEVIENIHASADVLQAEAPKCERLGKLTPETVQVLHDAGGMRMNLPKELGGYEASPVEFLQYVRTVARYSPSAGWIAGVVGIHPWEMALMDPKAIGEIYGNGPETWVASPYAPTGTGRPVEGGYLFTGEWQYSTGTDYCDWVVLGGMVTDAQGAVLEPPVIRHFVLPKGDYEIVEDSWNVVGLKGTGSKTVRMTDVFVPEYRTLDGATLFAGQYASRRPDSPLYRVPFGPLFGAVITAGTLGIATGALEVYKDYMRTRVSRGGIVAKTDPVQQTLLAEAEADLEAAILVLEDGMEFFWQKALADEPSTPEERLRYRRNHVRAVQNVLAAVEKVYMGAGSASVWTDWPLERYWRDLRVGGSHIANAPGDTYTSWVNHELQTGGPTPALK